MAGGRVDVFRWIWGWFSTTSAAIDGTAGFDQTLPVNRTHHTLAGENAAHHTLPRNRTHFTLPAEDR